MEWIRKFFWILCLPGILLITGCEESPTKSEDPDVVPRQSRKLGYHITPAAGQEYEGAIDVAMALNMDVLPFTMVWSDFDTTTGYNHEFLTIMNIFYPAYDLPLSLNITPIHAVSRAFPEGLESYSFSSDTVISRFTTFLDTVHAAIPDVELNNILFGNEPDLYFMSHEDEWDDFATFYAAAVAHARSLWGDDVPIGVEATFVGLTGEFESQMQAVNQHSDIIAFTYYPLNGDFTMQDPAVFGPMLDA
ncbi:MAG: hypothetical protein GF372_10695, partial [Candidatus Marinimicrobia bacterium]|nr:hypothetical protein [Candidatus Neomarinimicrobiota bacterium]